jgi:WD40 repeat protein
MRVMSVLLVLFAMVATATGQWIDRAFWFPDSMYGIEGSDKMLVESGTGRLWFAGFDAYRVQVYDPTAGTKVATVQGELSSVYGLAQSVPSHRVYVAAAGGLTAIDDRDYSVVAQINVTGTRSLVYDSRDDKMYTTMSYPESLLLVYKPGPDTLVGSLDIGGYIRTLVYDSVRNRLFALRENADIAVFDCSTESLVAHLPVSGEAVWDLALNPSTRRLYSIGWRSPAGNDIRVYDADSLTVLDTISLPSQWDVDDVKLALNPATSRLYGWYGAMMKGGWAFDSVAVLDCNSGVTSFVKLPDGYYLANVTLGDTKAYTTSEYADGVAVLGDDSILGWIAGTGRAPVVAGYDPGRNEVYISDYDERLSVVDAGSDTVVRVVDYTHLTPTWFRWNPSGKMYAGSYGELAAFGNDGKVLFRHQGRYLFNELPAWSSQLNRLYFTNRFMPESTLYVWDCAGDSIVRSLVLPARVESLWAVPDHELIYLPTGSQVLIYDTYSDTLVGSIPVAATNFAYNPCNGLVYAYSPNKSDVSVIDPRPGNIVTTLTVSPAVDVAVNTRDNEVYVNRGSTFCVFDGVSHEKVATVALPGGGWTFRYVEDWNQLLAFRGAVGWAFDCPARVKSRNFVMPPGSWTEFIWNGRNSKLYAHGGYMDSTLAVVRLPFDTVVASLPVHYFRAMGWNPVTNETYFSDYWRIYIVRDEMTGVEDASMGLERPVLLAEQNPTAGSVRFVCAAPGSVRLAVYDMTGRLVWLQMLPARASGVVWDRVGVEGKVVPRGVYVARLESASGRSTVKVVLR